VVLTCFASCPDSSLQLQSREMAALPGLGDGERWRQWRPVIRCGRLVQLEPVGFVCIKRRDDNGLWFRSFKEQTLVSMFPRKACLVPLPGLPRLPMSSCLSCESKFCHNCCVWSMCMHDAGKARSGRLRQSLVQTVVRAQFARLREFAEQTRFVLV